MKATANSHVALGEEMEYFEDYFIEQSEEEWVADEKIRAKMGEMPRLNPWETERRLARLKAKREARESQLQAALPEEAVKTVEVNQEMAALGLDPLGYPEASTRYSSAAKLMALTGAGLFAWLLYELCIHRKHLRLDAALLVHLRKNAHPLSNQV